MVYAGPSEACATCKRRRVKCDQTRPKCRNCIRRKAPCPGFPDPPGTRFKDETEAIIRQAQRPEGRQRVEQDEGLIPNLAQDEDFLSMCFFFHAYVITGRGIQSARGVF